MAARLWSLGNYGDFNEDGYLDVALANANAISVATGYDVYLNLDN